MEKKKFKVDYVFLPVEFTDIYTKSGEYEIVGNSTGSIGKQVLRRVKSNTDIITEKSEVENK